MIFAREKDVEDLKAEIFKLRTELRAVGEFATALMQRVEQLEGAKKAPRSHFSDKPPQQ